MAKHKYIETPERLLELFEEYVRHEQENPLYKRDYVGKDGLAVDTPLVTPITFEGFEVYLFQQKIISDLGHYSSNKVFGIFHYHYVHTQVLLLKQFQRRIGKPI